MPQMHNIGLGGYVGRTNDERYRFLYALASCVIGGEFFTANR
jgi:hypothetical protein